MLGSEDFIEGKLDALFVQCLPDQIPTFGGHVVVTLSEDHDQLAFDVSSSLETVVILPLAQGVDVDICREETDCGLDPRVQCTSVREVASQAHPRGSYLSVARLEAQKKGDCELSVFIVGGYFLGDFPPVSVVGAGVVVG